MASSEENIDVMEAEFSAANPARVGGGYQVWRHPPKL